MDFDLIIRNGKIIDGTGNPWIKADVGIAVEKIAKIGRLNGVAGSKEIDATGLIVSPGFVDPHSHADFNLPIHPKMDSTVHQSITTVIAGQCGSSNAPISDKYRDIFETYMNASRSPELIFPFEWKTFNEYLTHLDQEVHACNVAHLVGHGTIRIAAMGMDNRAPTPVELEKMRALVAEAMEAGAFGMSSGLVYPPGIFSKTSEVIELAKVVAKYGGIYCSHVRGEADTVVKAVDEAIQIGEKGGLPAQIAHHKTAGRRNWGRSIDTLAAIESARGREVDVTFDQYPYPASSTSLVTLLPPWVHEGGTERLLERLRDPNALKQIRYDIEHGRDDWDENSILGNGYDSHMICSVKTEQNKDLEGKTLTEITQLRDKPDEFTAMRDLLLEEEGAVSMVVFETNDVDIDRIMQHPLQMVSTDAGTVAPFGPLSGGKPHPRHYGTYPRVLGHYVRERKLLSLEEAIRKMTSYPAQRFGILDRGLLHEGMYADIVIFNPDTVIDLATFQEPHQYPKGMPYVIVNGKLVIEDGTQTKALPGKILRHQQCRNNS